MGEVVDLEEARKDFTRPNVEGTVYYYGERMTEDSIEFIDGFVYPEDINAVLFQHFPLEQGWRISFEEYEEDE